MQVPTNCSHGLRKFENVCVSTDRVKKQAHYRRIEIAKRYTEVLVFVC